MLSTTVRINKETQKALRELAALTGKSLQATLAEAIEAYRRQRFFEELNYSVQAQKANPEAWQSELQERNVWDTTLADDLEPEKWEESVKQGRGRHKTQARNKRHS